MRSSLLACVLLVGCATQPVNVPVDPVDALVDGLTGEFTTAAQVAALPADFARVPTPGQRWVDGQYAVMREFPAPAADERAIYLEWRKDGPEGEISRQRVWTFAPGAEGSILMRFYTLAAPADWVGQSDDQRGELARDGMLNGPNLPALKEIADFSSFPLIASGGITSLEDLKAVRAIGPKIEGAIVGKALYDGKLDYQAAVAAVSF